MQEGQSSRPPALQTNTAGAPSNEPRHRHAEREKRNAKTERARNERDANKKGRVSTGATRLIRSLRAEATMPRRYPVRTGLARMTPNPALPTETTDERATRRYRATGAVEHRLFPRQTPFPGARCGGHRRPRRGASQLPRHPRPGPKPDPKDFREPSRNPEPVRRR